MFQFKSPPHRYFHLNILHTTCPRSAMCRAGVEQRQRRLEQTISRQTDGAELMVQGTQLEMMTSDNSAGCWRRQSSTGWWFRKTYGGPGRAGQGLHRSWHGRECPWGPQATFINLYYSRCYCTGRRRGLWRGGWWRQWSGCIGEWQRGLLGARLHLTGRQGPGHTQR